VNGRPPGETRSATASGAQPRLPHEHDESSDSQTSDVRPVIKQAHDDVASGKVSTDRDAPMQETYERQKDGSTVGNNAVKNTGKRKGEST
jgi:hypothetical protein